MEQYLSEQIPAEPAFMTFTEMQLNELSVLKGMTDAELKGMLREDWYSYDQLAYARDYWTNSYLEPTQEVVTDSLPPVADVEPV